MPAPLTNDQKRILSQLARRAFNLDCARARGRSETPDTSTAAADTWRHHHVIRACGKHGLRCCSQDDYAAVKAHFQDLLGESGRAFNTLMHGEGNQRRIAEYKLCQALKEANLHISYAEKICQAQNKCGLQDASAGQLWRLMFTIKNRARKVTFRNSEADVRPHGVPASAGQTSKTDQTHGSTPLLEEEPLNFPADPIPYPA